jgi:hypothetical protein
LWEEDQVSSETEVDRVKWEKKNRNRKSNPFTNTHPPAHTALNPTRRRGRRTGASVAEDGQRVVSQLRACGLGEAGPETWVRATHDPRGEGVRRADLRGDLGEWGLRVADYGNGGGADCFYLAGAAAIGGRPQGCVRSAIKGLLQDGGAFADLGREESQGSTIGRATGQVWADHVKEGTSHGGKALVPVLAEAREGLGLDGGVVVLVVGGPTEAQIEKGRKTGRLPKAEGKMAYVYTVEGQTGLGGTGWITGGGTGGMQGQGVPISCVVTSDTLLWWVKVRTGKGGAAWVRGCVGMGHPGVGVMAYWGSWHYGVLQCNSSLMPDPLQPPCTLGVPGIDPVTCFPILIPPPPRPEDACFEEC